jgi:hypothetical protein
MGMESIRQTDCSDRGERVDKVTYMREYKRFATEKNRESGICIVCGKRRAEKGKSSCSLCLAKDRLRKQKYRESKEYQEHLKAVHRETYKKRAEEGKCRYCGSDKLFTSTRCFKCYMKAERAKAKRRLLFQQKRQKREYELGVPICSKCLNPAMEGKHLCKKHYDIVMKHAVPKANEATRKAYETAKGTGMTLPQMMFKAIVMRKKKQDERVLPMRVFRGRVRTNE